MCDVSDPRILNAYIAITEDEPTDWLLLGYKDTRDKITLYASGVNGLSEFRDHITNEILFGFVRVDDRFILITYVPDSVSGVRRARALVHSRSVANILELSHAQFTASTLSDMSDANIRTRLKLGEKQVPNRPRPSSMQNKRSSTINVAARRRKSGQYPPISPSPSPIMFERSFSPTPSSEHQRNSLRILTTTTTVEEPASYYDPVEDRMTATPTPSTPTSVASSFAESSISTLIDSADMMDIEKKRNNDAATEAFIQLQLAKKKELEEARFRQFQKDQQEERFKRDQAIKKFEQEKKEQQQPKQPLFQLNKRQSTMPLLQQKKSFENKVPQVILKKVNSNIVPPSPSPSPTPPFAALKKVVVVDTPAAKIEIKSEQSIIKPTSVIQSSVEKKEDPVLVPPPTIIRPTKKIDVIVQPVVVATPAKIVEKQTLLTGFASVQTKSSPFWKRRYFVIENDCMSFYKDELAKTPISEINLFHVTRLAPSDEDEDTYVPNSFTIQVGGKEKDMFQLFADDKKMVKQIYSTLKSIVKL